VLAQQALDLVEQLRGPDSSFSRRLMTRSSAPATSPAWRSAFCAAGVIASQALRVTTTAPTIGTQFRSSMYGAWL
jgi:hypothetical protein